MSHEPVTGWLLLLPQLPPQPSSLRVRVWRRLQQIGAVAVKNAAYALPDTETALEDMTWLRQEIIDAGGGALLLRAQCLGSADVEIVQLFREERDREYQKLAGEAAMFTDSLRHDKHLGPGNLSGAERTLRQFCANGWRRSVRSTFSARRARRWGGRGAPGTTDRPSNNAGGRQRPCVHPGFPRTGNRHRDNGG